jgi:hypothetical protein
VETGEHDPTFHGIPPPHGVKFSVWCPICGKKFNNRMAKTAHNQAQHQLGGPPRYKCSFCTQMFGRNSSRKRHELKQH